MIDQMARIPRRTPGQVRRAHIIINPAAGAEEPILGPINRVMSAARVDWTVTVTRRDGDAAEAAREAVKNGVDVVCAYGGDGTQCEVASALAGGSVPLAVLAGGTGNVLAQALGIPLDLEDALRLACARPSVLSLDALRCGDSLSLLRIGAGAEAKLMEKASRERKDTLGWFAYLLSGVEVMTNFAAERVRLRVDGVEWEVDAVGVIVANIGRLSRLGAKLPGQIDPTDGCADVLIVRRLGPQVLFSTPARVSKPSDLSSPEAKNAPIWQVRGQSIELESPTWSVQRDGDLIGKMPVTIEVVADCVPIIVPVIDESAV